MPGVHTFAISGDGLPAQRSVLAFRGSEAISRPYRFEVFLRVHGSELEGFDPRTLLGRRATLTVTAPDDTVRRAVHGAWSSVAFARALPDGDALFRAVLSPKLWRLSLARRSRVFVGRTLPEIVTALLQECGFVAAEYELRVEQASRYTALEHVCQYRETNLDFLSRRLEHDGLYYYFEHPENGSAERLIITDSVTFAEPLDADPVPFLAPGVQSTDGEGLPAVSCQYAAVPTGAQTFGYDYGSPDLDVRGASPASPTPPLLVNSWEPSRTASEAGRAALVRAQEARARETVLEAGGHTFNLRPGYTFELEDHPSLAGEYLVTAMESRFCAEDGNLAISTTLGCGPGGYSVDAAGIPGAVQFRPERVTERPRVHGLEPGVVKGPLEESPYAQVDEHGRYLVQLLFDDDRTKSTPSTRMRMAQSHAGAHGAGMHFPLRNGTEVLVSFLGGDPDQPVIAGVVPNALTPSPIVDANHTRNVLHTEGGSRLEIEDQALSQYVQWTTPVHNTRLHLGSPHATTAGGSVPTAVDLSTDGTALHRTGQSHDTVVGTNRRAFVDGKVWEVFGPRPANFTAPGVPAPASSYPATTHTETVYGTRSTTVTGDVTEEYRSSRTTSVTANVVETFGGTQTTGVTGDVTRNYAGAHTTNVTGDVSENYSGSQTTNVTGDVELTCASQSVTVRGANEHLTEGNVAMINAGGSATLNAAASIQLNFAVSMALSFAASLDMWVGMKAELWAGVKLEGGVGMKVETVPSAISIAEFGTKISTALGPNMDIGPIHITF